MRPLLLVPLLVACSSSPKSAQPPAPVAATPPATTTEATQPAAPAVQKETLAADTPRTTVAGNTFIAPAGWRIWVSGPATIIEAPEGDSRIALVDLQAKDVEDAVKRAWAAYRPNPPWPLHSATDAADKDGWTKIRAFNYETSPNEKRAVAVRTLFANDTWTVAIIDLAEAVAEKRGGQLALIFGQLMPKGVERESFKGKTAHALDAARIKELGAFIERAQQQLGVPGVALGLVQDGKVVFAGGFGVREVGKPAKVDGDTMFMIASNTKALTTLMLAKLVDEKQLTWETKATALLPSFKLGNPETTEQVRVKHLICACTGMPRQDLEWLLEFKDLTPAKVMTALGGMQPTSEFGALFQYSNPLAAAAGFVGGHVAYPKLELGKAYDQAMQTRVFGPLGMRSTTFDYKRAQRGNWARPHSQNVDDKTVLAVHAINYSVIPLRPAGAAWSNVKDVLKYVQMELAEGKLPNGKPYISREALLARRAPQVAIGKDTTYGMGLTVNTKYDVTVVNHGGDLIGHHSDMMWLPEHGVGAVVLTSGDPGGAIRSLFRRKLLEVLFDGKPEADRDVEAAAKSYFAGRQAERKLWTVPADAGEAAKLATAYTSNGLGDLAVQKQGATVVFDFGEWKTEVGTKKNPDGTTSFVTLAPGLQGFGLVAGTKDGKPILTVRDAQHEYVFVAK